MYFCLSLDRFVLRERKDDENVVQSRRRVLTIFEDQESRVNVEGDESQTMSEDFVGDDGGVAPYVHTFYTYRGHLHL